MFLNPPPPERRSTSGAQRKEGNAMLNQATLIGRLGKDPDLSYTQSGTARCKFSLATSEKFRDRNGEMQQNTEWHNIIVWGKQAETCSKYLHKGSLVTILGQITTRSWDDDSGQKRYMTEIKANKIVFMGDNRQQGGQQGHGGEGGGNGGRRGGDGGYEGGGGPGGGHGVSGDEDLPF